MASEQGKIRANRGKKIEEILSDFIPQDIDEGSDDEDFELEGN